MVFRKKNKPPKSQILIKGLVKRDTSAYTPFPSSRRKGMFPKGLLSAEQLWWILCIAVTQAILLPPGMKRRSLSVASRAQYTDSVFQVAYSLSSCLPLHPFMPPLPQVGSLPAPQTCLTWDGTCGDASFLLAQKTGRNQDQHILLSSF